MISTLLFSVKIPTGEEVFFKKKKLNFKIEITYFWNTNRHKMERKRIKCFSFLLRKKRRKKEKEYENLNCSGRFINQLNYIYIFIS